MSWKKRSLIVFFLFLLIFGLLLSEAVTVIGMQYIVYLPNHMALIHLKKNILKWAIHDKKKKEKNIATVHLSTFNGYLMHDPCGLAVDEFYYLCRIVDVKEVGKRLWGGGKFKCKKQTKALSPEPQPNVETYTDLAYEYGITGNS